MRHEVRKCTNSIVLASYKQLSYTVNNRDKIILTKINEIRFTGREFKAFF